MPLLIYGTLRSSLQQICLRQVIGLTGQYPKKRALLVVPEQTKLDAEQAYLAKADTPGLMMAEVLSFRRLAWRILGEIGQQPLHPVDRAGRAMLIHRVLHQQQQHLHAFAYLADKPGFVAQVAAVLGDLKRYRISSEQLLQVAEQAEDKALQEKSSDLACVLSAYNEALAQSGLTDAEDDLTRLAGVLQILADLPGENWPWPWSRLSWLRQAHIWVNGFGETRDFTPQEDAVIAGLASLAEQMTLTVAADAVPADQAACGQGPDAYFAGRRTAWRLTRLLPGLRLQALPDEPGELSRQIRSLLRTGHPVPGSEHQASLARSGRGVHLVQAASLDDELSWVAGEIRSLVQAEGYRYRDINIAVCNLPAVTLRLRAVFREYGIPLFLDMERPLSGTPLVRLVLGLMDIGLTGWTRPALLAYLRSGLTGLLPDEVDQLENAWLARGLYRRDRIFKDAYYQDAFLPDDQADPQTDLKDDLDDSEIEVQESIEKQTAKESTCLLRWRDQALLPVRQVLDTLQHSPGVSEKVSVLQQFLRSQQIAERISQRIEQLAASGEMDLAVALAQSWNALQHLLEQLVHLSPDLPMSLRLFRDTLAAGMDAASSGVIPSAIDQVNVGDLQRAALRQPRVQFVIGATAADLPPEAPAEGLLKDPDRQLLSMLTGHQLPSSLRDKAFHDTFIQETLVTQPAERLYLTTPDAAAARVFRLMAGIWPERLQILPRKAAIGDPRLNAPVPAYRWLLQQVPGPSETGESAAFRQLKALLASAGYIRPDLPLRQSNVRPDLVGALYTSPLVLSVSQLERYTACPFSHLAGRLLSLRRRPEWHPEHAETGILLHGILEQALKHIRRQLQAWPDRLQPDLLPDFWRQCRQEQWQDHIEAWLKAEAARNRIHRLFDAGLNASIGRRIRQMAAASLAAILYHYERGPYVPVDFEWVFGPENNNPLLLDKIDDRPVFLRGVIDRVDDRLAQAGQPERRFRIVDYKSSQQFVDFDAFYHGLSLQLPVYLAAYARAHPGSVAEDGAWFTLNRPILNIRDRRSAEPDDITEQLLNKQKPVGLQLEAGELRMLSTHALKQAGRQVRQLLDGHFPVYPMRLPKHRPPCAFCDFKAFCGFDAARDAWHRPEKPEAAPAAGKRLTAREAFLALLAESCREDH